jgi:uncharacterized protein (TIGR00369 family)
MPDESEALEWVRSAVANKITFNKILGLEVGGDLEKFCIRFPMKEELVGNFVRKTLHGGAIATAMDVTGGTLVLLEITKKFKGKSFQEVISKFGELGTIDMRVDFLRPGTGKEFFCTGSVLRLGRRIAVTRMEMHNEENQLIATATATYIIG